MLKTLLIYFLIFSPAMLFASDTYHGANNLCPRCSHDYLGLQNKYSREFPSPAGLMLSMLSAQDKSDYMLGDRKGVWQDLYKYMAQASRLEAEDSEGLLAKLLTNEKGSSSLSYNFFYQVPLIKQSSDIREQIARSPYQVFALSGKGIFGNLFLSLNIMQNHINAGLSWSHELFHLNDPFVVEFGSDNSFDALETFLLEYRAYLAEKRLYPYFKESFVKIRGFQSVETPAYKELAKKKELSNAMIEFVLDRLFPVAEDKLPMYIPINKYASGIEDIITSEHQSNQHSHFSIESSDTLKKLSNIRAFKMWDTFSKLYPVEADRAKTLVNYYHPESKVGAYKQALFENQFTLNIPLKNPKLLWNSGDFNFQNKQLLIGYLQQINLYDKNQSLEKNYLTFHSKVKEQYQALNQSKRDEIRSLLQVPKSKSLEKPLLKYIKEHNYNQLNLLPQINEDTNYIGPKGVNGGD